MELNDQLRELVTEISPTDSQQRELRDAHIRLRERLMADEDLKPLIVGTFLQGSYRRHTAKRPETGDKPDVDIVVVTRLNRHEYTPEQAMNVLRPFLNGYYPGKWKKKGRSVGIEMGKVKLDVVLTSAPSEALERSLIKVMQQENDYGDTFDTGDEWRNEPLWIPDREAKNWQRTHPREQIRWTQEKNRRTNGHYIHVVKLVKWWWQTQHPEQEHPRSYPLEHIVGDCCPDGVTSLAQAFTETMERIARYNPAAGSPDRGVPEQNVLKRITMADASRFQQFAVQAAALARRACNSKDEGESANLWRQIFGSKYTVRKSQSGFTPRNQPGQIKGNRFA
ncbi:MAG: nucleotidyltransferase [Chloroflexi bacterium]|nr:nucleotidyltransferase [Chloroflexota bacterium]